jgi:hypothetical protein
MNPEFFVAALFACDFNTLVCVIGYVLCGLIGLLGLAVLWLIYNGDIDLSRLISEANGDASMSRFQFLVFTFVISLSLFLVIVAGNKDSNGKPAFPAEIPAGILTLLGISGSSYAVGKAISYSDPAGLEERPITVTITPSTVTMKYGEKKQFTADVPRKPDAKVIWEITAGPAAPNDARITDTGLFTAPAGPSMPPSPHATIKATLADYPNVSDVAVVTFMQDQPSMVTITPSTATVKLGASQQFTAQVSPPQPTTSLKWEVVPSALPAGTIDANGKYTAPAAGTQGTALHATVRVSLVDNPTIADLAVVTLTA